MTEQINALIKKIDEDIEEEVVLIINGIEMTCFIGVCPYNISEGKEYPVSLSFTTLDDLEFEEVEEQECYLMRLGSGFSYSAVGEFSNESVLIKGITFECEDLEDMSYLQGKYIKLNADRITVDFIGN